MHERSGSRRGVGVGVLLLLALLVALGLVLFSSQLTRDNVDTTRAWSAALSNARVHLTLHHLRIEEAISGDRRVDVPRQVFGNLSAAAADCRALLEGGGSSRAGLHVARLPAETGRAELESACRQVSKLGRVARVRLARPAASDPGSRIDNLFDATFESAVVGLTRALDEVNVDAGGDATDLARLNYGTAALLVLLFAGLAIVLRRGRRQSEALHERDARDIAAERAEAEYRERQVEFSRTVQGTRSEHEVDLLLKRYLELTLPDTRVTSLRRNNSANRLEPTTGVDATSALAECVRGAQPDSCAAVRLSTAHSRGDGREPLLTCDICGCLPGPSTCLPSLVGGEVIGSVLVERSAPLGERDEQHLEEVVNQAAPVIANLRNLARAERQAATDQLTGLPNRRAADDMLKRSLALALRGDRPLAVIMFDLDHFKHINDSHGHAEGDKVLAGVAAAAAWAARAEDFVARSGGEEFTVLLPNTDATGALVVCERLQAAIRQVRIAGTGRAVTASFGIADFPAIATDGDNLLRAADRALYSAKERGRDRIETASSTVDVAALDHARAQAAIRRG
jgi:diguanylate cyclase (GGDEF)-like protein